MCSVISIEERAKVAKNKFNEFFLDHAKEAIKKQMEVTGKSFVLGERPYWEYESSFTTSIKSSYHIFFENITCNEGCATATLSFTPQMQKIMANQYDIVTLFELTAYEPQYDDCTDERVVFESYEDFSKIISFDSISLFVNTEEQIKNIESFLNDFKHLRFIASLNH